MANQRQSELEASNKALARNIEILQKTVEQNTKELQREKLNVKRSVIENNSKFLGIQKVIAEKPARPTPSKKIGNYEVSGTAVAVGAGIASLIPKLLDVANKAMESLDRRFNMTHLDAQEKTKQTVMDYARQGMQLSDKDIAWIYHQHNDQNARAYEAMTNVERVTHRSGYVQGQVMKYTGFDIDREWMQFWEHRREKWEDTIDKEQMLEYQANRGSIIAQEKLSQKRTQRLAEINTNEQLTESN